jgi:GGDEF domain-containing protein
VSIGVAISPDDGESYEDLLAAADRRMYEDKQQRRDLRASRQPEPREATA